MRNIYVVNGLFNRVRNRYMQIDNACMHVSVRLVTTAYELEASYQVGMHGITDDVLYE